MSILWFYLGFFFNNVRLPPISTRPDAHFPDTTLVRSQHRIHTALAIDEIRREQRRRLAGVHAGIIEIELGHGGCDTASATPRAIGNQATPSRARKRPGCGTRSVSV